MNLQKIQKNKGFVILFAITISSIILAIALGVANIAQKEVKFSTGARETNEAFLAADSAIEYALFQDKDPMNYPAPASGTQSWAFVVSGLGGAGLSCANVNVSKTTTTSTLTTITSKGYNVGDPSTCVSSNTSRIERELKIVYNSGSSLPPSNPPQTPLRTLSLNNGVNLGSDYNMGYKFTPNTNGSITELAFRINDSGSHTVRLFSISGTVLASATANGVSGSWVSTAIVPVSVTSGTSYVVAVRTNSGVPAYYESGIRPPQTNGNIEINEGRWINGTDAMPTNAELWFYGEADITFVPN